MPNAEFGLKKIESSSVTIEFNSSSSEDYRFPKSQLAFIKSSFYDPIYGNVTGGNDFWCLVRSYLPNFDPDIPWANGLNLLQDDLLAILKSRRLNFLTVRPKDRTAGDFSKTYQFSYTSRNGARRLLSSFIERGGDYIDEFDEKIEYKFQYHTNTDGTKEFPFGLNGQFAMTDHWGYFNNGTFSYTASAEQHAAKKTPSEEYTKAHTLTKITYPTGGYTTFEYELNTYRKYVTNSFITIANETVDKNGGGLRVKEIKSYINTDELALRKRYYYTTDTKPNTGLNSGILKAEPLYVSSFKARDPSDPDCSPACWFFIDEMTGDITLTLYNSGGFYAQSTNNNTPIVGYSSVIEETLDGSGNSCGYVRYTYSNYDNDINGESHFDEQRSISTVTGNTYLNQFASKAQERGKLMSEEFYDENKRKVKENKYKYTKYGPSDYFNTVHQQTINFCTAGWNFLYSKVGSVFRTYYYSYLLNEINSTEYGDDNRVYTEKCEYSYDIFKSLSSLAKTNSNNKNYWTLFYYSGDTRLYNIEVFQQMNLAGILNAPVAEDTYTFTYSQPIVFSYIRSKYTKYTKYNNNYYAPSAVYSLCEEVPSVSEGLTSIIDNLDNNGWPTDARFQSEYFISSYDTKGNIREVYGRDFTYTVYLWGYNHKYPIAEIKGESFYGISLIINETMINEIAAKTAPTSSDWTLINNLRTNPNLKHAQITTYTYQPLVGMKSMTDPRGVTTYYKYDELGRLIEIKENYDKKVEEYEYHFR